MKWNKLILPILFLTALNSFGQGILTLDKAISIALENNYGIVIAKNGIQKAKNNNHLFNKQLLPSVTATAAGTRNNNSSKSTNAEGEEFEQNDAVTKNYSAGLKVSYTLFDGFQRWYANKNFEAALSLSELDARQIVETTLIQVYSTYYAASLLTENVSNQSEILTISKQRLERVKARSNYGQVSQLDVLNAQVDVNNDSIALLELANQLANTKRDLNLLLGRSIEIPFSTTTNIQFLTSLNKQDVMNSALEENVAILQSRKQLYIGQNLDAINKGNWLPKLSINSSYNWSLQDNKLAQNPANPFQQQEQENLGFNTGLNLSWNLFNGGSNIIRKQNSTIDVLNAENNLELVQQEISRDLLNAWSNYQNDLFLLSAQSKNVETNKNNFKRTEEKFKLGQINSITFRQAQINLLNAQTAYNKSKFDAKLSELVVLQLSGQLDQVSVSE